MQLSVPALIVHGGAGAIEEGRLMRRSAGAGSERAKQGTRRPRTDPAGACPLEGKGGRPCAPPTGGTAGNRPGRIGAAPLPGAATYADERAGAASATGHGESI